MTPQDTATQWNRHLEAYFTPTELKEYGITALIDAGVTLEDLLTDNGTELIPRGEFVSRGKVKPSRTTAATTTKLIPAATYYRLWLRLTDGSSHRVHDHVRSPIPVRNPDDAMRSQGSQARCKVGDTVMVLPHGIGAPERIRGGAE